MLYSADTTAPLLPQATTHYTKYNGRGRQEPRNKNCQALGNSMANFKSHNRIKNTNRADITNLLFLNIQKPLGVWGPQPALSPSWLRLWQALS